MHKLGIPDEHIIVFMYDDIAMISSNPKKGQIINDPDGPDVYAGVPHDYTGKAVSSANFIKVLTGEDMTGIGSGKTLKSTENDHVFVFFDDHGSEGALCWPEGCTLTAAKMGQTINTMANNRMFKNLIIYVEACFAGSVFYKQTLPPHVYVTTASPVAESSFAYNYDSTIRAYVADIYSYLFIHHTEISDMGASFQAQFNYIQDNIQNYSQSCQYGDKDAMSLMTLGQFYKPTTDFRYAHMRHMWHHPRHQRRLPRVLPADAVRSWDVPVETARRIYEAEPTPENLAELKRQEEYRIHVDEMAQRIVEAAVTEPHLRTPACTTCTSACKCYSYCISSHSAAHCTYECCNEESCYNDPPKFGVDPVAKEQCEEQLIGAFLEECGNDHPYLRSVEQLLLRSCKSPNVNVAKALEQIHAECKRA